MARLKILGHHFVLCDYSLRDIYWTEMSELVIKKFGKKKFTDHSDVEEILLFCFTYLTNRFKDVVLAEKSFQFFKYVFWLHEESIKIYLKYNQGERLELIDDDEFARHRRILKNILEQGCDVNLTNGNFPESQKELLRLEGKLTHLLYLGTWLYHFADHIAFQKMVEDFQFIDFDEENVLEIDFQHHYGIAYRKLFSLLGKDYERGSYELDTIPILIEKINDCFNINFDWAKDIIFGIKAHHHPEDPSLQTIEPFILPKNLANHFGITEAEAELFYNGLTLSRDNKMSLEELVLKPYSTYRYMYRPILVYKVDGVERALIGEEKFPESLMTLATNALNWNSLPKEWLENPCMQIFMQKMGNEHDKLLEEEVQQKILEKKMLFCRNLKSLKQHKTDNFNIDNSICGEIDFIIINDLLKKVIVVDCKYNKARYEAVGYRMDYTNFKNNYEPKMQKKHDWVSSNLPIVNQHFQVIYKDMEIDVIGYEVETVFFINTPTFYMFNGNFKAIPLSQISNYLNGNYRFDSVVIEHNGNEIKHPFFQRPITHEN